MCECGCADCNQRYRLPIDEKTFYGFELYGGCEDCSTPPALFIKRVTVGSDLTRWYEDAPTLSLAGERDEVVIKCGFTPEELRQAVLKRLVGTKIEDKNGLIDEFVAEEIAEEIADELGERPLPEVIDLAEVAS